MQTVVQNRNFLYAERGRGDPRRRRLRGLSGRTPRRAASGASHQPRGDSNSDFCDRSRVPRAPSATASRPTGSAAQHRIHAARGRPRRRPDRNQHRPGTPSTARPCCAATSRRGCRPSRCVHHVELLSWRSRRRRHLRPNRSHDGNLSGATAYSSCDNRGGGPRHASRKCREPCESGEQRCGQPRCSLDSVSRLPRTCRI
jgi:hypothetical protein